MSGLMSLTSTTSSQWLTAAGHADPMFQAMMQTAQSLARGYNKAAQSRFTEQLMVKSNERPMAKTIRCRAIIHDVAPGKSYGGRPAEDRVELSVVYPEDMPTYANETTLKIPINRKIGFFDESIKNQFNTPEFKNTHTNRVMQILMQLAETRKLAVENGNEAQLAAHPDLLTRSPKWKDWAAAFSSHAQYIVLGNIPAKYTRPDPTKQVKSRAHGLPIEELPAFIEESLKSMAVVREVCEIILYHTCIGKEARMPLLSLKSQGPIVQHEDEQGGPQESSAATPVNGNPKVVPASTPPKAPDSEISDLPPKVQAALDIKMPLSVKYPSEFTGYGKARVKRQYMPPKAAGTATAELSFVIQIIPTPPSAPEGTVDVKLVKFFQFGEDTYVMHSFLGDRSRMIAELRSKNYVSDFDEALRAGGPLNLIFSSDRKTMLLNLGNEMADELLRSSEGLTDDYEIAVKKLKLRKNQACTVFALGPYKHHPGNVKTTLASGSAGANQRRHRKMEDRVFTAAAAGPATPAEGSSSSEAADGFWGLAPGSDAKASSSTANSNNNGGGGGGGGKGVDNIAFHWFVSGTQVSNGPLLLSDISKNRFEINLNVTFAFGKIDWAANQLSKYGLTPMDNNVSEIIPSLIAATNGIIKCESWGGDFAAAAYTYYSVMVGQAINNQFKREWEETLDLIKNAAIKDGSDVLLAAKHQIYTLARTSENVELLAKYLALCDRSDYGDSVSRFGLKNVLFDVRSVIERVGVPITQATCAHLEQYVAKNNLSCGADVQMQCGVVLINSLVKPSVTAAATSLNRKEVQRSESSAFAADDYNFYIVFNGSNTIGESPYPDMTAEHSAVIFCPEYYSECAKDMDNISNYLNKVEIPEKCRFRRQTLDLSGGPSFPFLLYAIPKVPTDAEEYALFEKYTTYQGGKSNKMNDVDLSKPDEEKDPAPATVSAPAEDEEPRNSSAKRGRDEATNVTQPSNAPVVEDADADDDDPPAAKRVKTETSDQTDADIFDV